MPLKGEKAQRQVYEIAATLPPAARDAMRDAVAKAAGAVIDSYQQQFARATDPYGKPWPAGDSQPNPIHTKTYGLANPRYRVSGMRIVLQPDRHGWIHHAGWVGGNGAREEREFVPYREGSWWFDNIEDAVTQAVAQELATLGASTGADINFALMKRPAGRSRGTGGKQ